MTAETHPIEKEQVMAYLDGELSPEASKRVAAHLAECPECGALEGELRMISSELFSWNVEPSPARLTHGVTAMLQAESLVDRRKVKARLAASSGFFQRVLFSRWTWATACAAMVLLIALKFFSMTGPRFASRSELEQAADRFSVADSVESRNSSGGGDNGSLAGDGALASKKGSGRGFSVDGQPPVDSNGGFKSWLEQRVPSAQPLPPIEGKNTALTTVVANGPMIARTASLKVSVKDFAAARASVDRIVRARGGYAAGMTINTQKGEPQSLQAELHIPAPVCDAALADLKALGRVEQEQQGGEEVTAQVIDLDARLKNSRIEETRLEDILRTRTGKVGEVLQVEREMARVREEIEQMEGNQKELHNRIEYTSIQLDLHEEYAASLDVNSSSVGRRIRNSLVDGFGAAGSGFLSLGLFLLYIAPSLIVLALILFWPVRWAWRRFRHA